MDTFFGQVVLLMIGNLFAIISPSLLKASVPCKYNSNFYSVSLVRFGQFFFRTFFILGVTFCGALIEKL